jgi:ribosomal protein S13
MDIPEIETASETATKAENKLNTYVAIAVALLATFMGICKVKDDNIVQAMQLTQTKKVDSFNWYQARNIRQEVLTATAASMEAEASAATSATAKFVFENKAKEYKALAEEQAKKKEIQKTEALEAEKSYDQLNVHDDQFDLADALLSIAISLLALTSLTHKRWLFLLAMIPTVFGILMGFAGLLGWSLHSDFFSKLLS